MPRHKLASKACDRCKARKVKCTGLRPCQRCGLAGVECSYFDIQRMRGPPSRKSQRASAHDTALSINNRSPSIAISDPFGVSPSLAQTRPTPKTSVTLRKRRVAPSILRCILDLYWSRLFPIWPIVDTDDLISRLLHGQDEDAYFLTLALAAATLEQLDDTAELPGQCPSAAFCESECQRVRNALHSYGQQPTLDRVCTAFFLHAYHESLSAGSPTALMHLREAVSLAQIMGLYADPEVPPSNAILRHNVYTLLFITERGISVFHRLPPVLTPISLNLFTSITEAGEPLALSCLARIFSEIEQSGLLKIIAQHGQALPEDLVCLKALDETLRASLWGLAGLKEANLADIYVTTCWLRVLLWRVLHRNGFSFLATTIQLASLPDLLDIIENLIHTLRDLPAFALKANGFGMGSKIFEITSALIESVRYNANTAAFSGSCLKDRIVAVLMQLHDLLSTLRTGNKPLLDKLFAEALDLQVRNLPTDTFDPVSFSSYVENLLAAPQNYFDPSDSWCIDTALHDDHQLRMSESHEQNSNDTALFNQ